MSKWRPAAKNCLYVIPDVHGSLELLKKVCDRILPLRKSDGGKDRLVFLGDYIDRHVNSHLVIDYLIELKKKYPDQVIFLMGNHEHMLLQAIDAVPGKTMSFQTRFHAYRMWMHNGGGETIAGYIKRKNGDEEWGSLPLSRVEDFIPKEHIEFFQSLQKGYEFENYVFVHGGMNPSYPIQKHDLEEVIWDRSLVKFVLNCIQSNIDPPEWDKTVICGHSVQSNGQPIIWPNYMMLDCGSPRQLLVVELNSLEAYMAYPGKTRMVKFPLTETKSLPIAGAVRRSQ